MIQVFVGETRSRKLLRRTMDLGWGRIWAHDTTPAPLEGELWAFDNGAYSAYLKGQEFPEARFLKRYERAQTMTTPPYLAVVPDIVAGGMGSLTFSLRWRDRLNDWPWYLAVQDGLIPDDVIRYRDRFSGIFLGGGNGYKATAHEWRTFTRVFNMGFHYGRVGTPRKLTHTVEVGADSCDSSFPLWTAERFDVFAEHWKHGDPQFSLLEDM